MGLNTVAVLLNDCCDEIEREGGEIGKRMSEAMQNWGRVKGAGDLGVGRIIARSHSDWHQIVVVHGNTGCSIYDAKDLPYMALDAMADCLRRHGWSAKPPPKRKRAKPDGGDAKRLR